MLVVHWEGIWRAGSVYSPRSPSQPHTLPHQAQLCQSRKGVLEGSAGVVPVILGSFPASRSIPSQGPRKCSPPPAAWGGDVVGSITEIQACRTVPCPELISGDTEPLSPPYQRLGA